MRLTAPGRPSVASWPAFVDFGDGFGLKRGSRCLLLCMDLRRPVQNAADEKNVKTMFHAASGFENDER